MTIYLFVNKPVPSALSNAGVRVRGGFVSKKKNCSNEQNSLVFLQ